MVADEGLKDGRAVPRTGGFQTVGAWDRPVFSVAELSPSESESVFPLNRDVVPGWCPSTGGRGRFERASSFVTRAA